MSERSIFFRHGKQDAHASPSSLPHSSAAALARHAEMPELPRIAIFCFWSALLHATLLLALNELIQAGQPVSYPVLQVRLAPGIAPSPALPIPDLMADSIRELESTLQEWTKVSPSPTSAISRPLQDAPDRESGNLIRTNADYYHKSSELDVQPVPVREVVPVYPDQARSQGIEGYAKLLILIDEEGGVRHIEVLESNPQVVFGEAAMDAFRTMSFVPGNKGNMPVKSRMVIKVDFKVEPGGI